jgi:hypothetical protein
MQAIPESLGPAVAPEATDDYPTSPVDITSSSQTLAIRDDMRERRSPVPGLLAAFPDVTLSFGALPSAKVKVIQRLTSSPPASVAAQSATADLLPPALFHTLR